MTHFGTEIRFKWCPAHVGIVGNKLADVCAKTAALTGTQIANLVSYKEVYNSIHEEYLLIDSRVIDSISRGTGTNYMTNFNDTKIQFIERLTHKRKDCIILTRIITGYMNTNKRLFKMRVDSSDCVCGFSPQDLNHLFRACPLLNDQRQRLYHCLIQLELQHPFSIEYLLRNINKTIATVICKFMYDRKQIKSQNIINIPWAGRKKGPSLADKQKYMRIHIQYWLET